MENNVELEEQLISFETAKLAKEKGFDIHCRFYYDEEMLSIYENEDFPYNSWNENLFAPTQSLLQKWLRELHGVDIHITRNKPSYREYRVEIYKVDNTPNYIYFQINEENSKFCKWFDDYEEALEASLLEALKLIK